jgi:hypothetical protein
MSDNKKKPEPKLDKDPKQGWLSALAFVVQNSQGLAEMANSFFAEKEQTMVKDRREIWEPPLSKTDLEKVISPIIQNLAQQADCQQQTQRVIAHMEEREVAMQKSIGDLKNRVQALEDTQVRICCVFCGCGFSCQSC